MARRRRTAAGSPRRGRAAPPLGVEVQHPDVAAAFLGEALLGAVAGPVVVDDPRAERGSEVLGAVGRPESTTRMSSARSRTAAIVAPMRSASLRAMMKIERGSGAAMAVTAGRLRRTGAPSRMARAKGEGRDGAPATGVMRRRPCGTDSIVAVPVSPQSCRIDRAQPDDAVGEGCRDGVDDGERRAGAGPVARAGPRARGCAGTPHGVLAPVAETVPGRAGSRCCRHHTARARPIPARCIRASAAQAELRRHHGVDPAGFPARGGQRAMAEVVAGNPATDFVTLKAEPLDRIEATARLRRSTRAGKRHALVFVHGFNNRFEDAVFRFAQIVHDTGRRRGASAVHTGRRAAACSPTATTARARTTRATPSKGCCAGWPGARRSAR